MHVPILCVNDFAEEKTRLSELPVADAAALRMIADGVLSPAPPATH
jgi:hypothetical protein